MAEIIDLGAYRTHRLLERFCDDRINITQDATHWKSRMFSVSNSLDKCVSSLECFDSKLKSHRLSCEDQARRSREIQKAIESGDFKELKRFQRNLRKATGKS